ncbi:uncharacterized protein FOMMEDRAFT_27101 [Fomitiporia mediterranea MF3/22]|uniref:uncharacterized protein n=1 Tax=Fomitiporia mediterranea (strain MF3/22) TaxID=694068 RepID=UPI000440769E|nr:uncharacterized protein FOMMEDRAFT_27101 [Fomitiporia mediterranea MF3/22]EJD04788.1 hypothetical protein FOMMEDRAFT_27101 [Fomitiporia mediterranea MF3/22]
MSESTKKDNKKRHVKLKHLAKIIAALSSQGEKEILQSLEKKIEKYSELKAAVYEFLYKIKERESNEVRVFDSDFWDNVTTRIEQIDSIKDKDQAIQEMMAFNKEVTNKFIYEIEMHIKVHRTKDETEEASEWEELLNRMETHHGKYTLYKG